MPNRATFNCSFAMFATENEESPLSTHHLDAAQADVYYICLGDLSIAGSECYRKYHFSAFYHNNNKSSGLESLDGYQQFIDHGLSKELITRKMARKSWFHTCCLLFCVITQVRVCGGKNLYISRASGNDSWLCEQEKPCKTIWRVVPLASSSDYVHLDGTNTDKDPYNCQSNTSVHAGIKINKSLSLIGFGPIPPQIHCSKGTVLTFDGSSNPQQINFTLSGLFLYETTMYFQDSSAKIHNCKFASTKRGVQFLANTRTVLTIQITNSIFVGNKECISVVVNSSTDFLHQSMQVIFNLNNSTFYDNVMPDESCMLFSALPQSKQSVSCNITLENVIFSHNKFSSRGIVFLQLENGNQNIKLQRVTFTNNDPVSGPYALAGYSTESECIIRSNAVNVIINGSNFTGRNARLVDVTGTKISLQVHSSTFYGHKVKENGGVISIKGLDLCNLNVTNSSFVNTTAGHGGAFNVECANVRFRLHENSFTENIAMNGNGGAISVHDALDSGLSIYEHRTNERPVLGQWSRASKHHLEIDVTKCSFSNAYSSSDGGAVYIKASKNDLLLTVESSRFLQGTSNGVGGSLGVLYTSRAQINVTNSHFTSCHAVGSGGGLDIKDLMISDERRTRNGSFIMVENSTFVNNSAADGGGAMSVVANKQSTVILDTVIMDYNKAIIGGAAYVVYIFALKIRRSRFSRNAAGGNGGVLYTVHVNSVETQESLLEDNYVRNETPKYNKATFGGAMFLTETTGTISITISIINTTFRNCSAQQEGGAIYVIHEGKNVSLLVQRSWFVENYSLENRGGAIFLRLQPIEEKGPICNDGNLNDDDESRSSWTCINRVRFEDTTFVRNTGEVGGGVYLTTGDATFRNCHFLDNFASSKGGHIKTAYGTASLTIQGCLFLQTRKELQLGQENSSEASFIHAESSGALNISNTTMDVRAYGTANPLLLITNGKRIDIGNDDNLTNLYCPVGSQMEITNFTTGNPYDIKTIVRTIEFSCLVCKGNSYSLQRGQALGCQSVPGFECLPCPFGADCTQNIASKRNFWGFQEQDTPPKLRFTTCPAGYCSPPQGTNSSIYNGCQGKRSGELCGHCGEGYTETLYTTNCSLLDRCNDHWVWAVALFFVLLMALFFTFKPPIVPWLTRQILWFRKTEQQNQDDNFDKGYLKILFYFYQVANLLGVSNSPHSAVKANVVQPVVGIFNFKLVSSRSICPLPGLTVVTKELFSASYVIAVLLTICVFYILHWGIQKVRGQAVPSGGRYYGGILQTVLLGYTTLAAVSFSLLRCVPIGAEMRLFHDGNVVCFRWWQYVLIAFVCTFVVPFVFVLLWGAYKVYSETLSGRHFLLACLFPLPSLINWIFVCFSRVSSRPLNNNSIPSHLSRNSVANVLYDSFKRPEGGTKLSLSWEGIMIGRRLILVMMKTFISDPFPRLLIMSLCCYIFLLHHIMAQPFRDSFANTVETLSLLSIVVLATGNVFFASFLTLAVPLNDHFNSWKNAFQGLEIAILCFVPVAFVFLVVTTALSQLCRLAIVFCRGVRNFSWNTFRSLNSTHRNETSPLLASLT